MDAELMADIGKEMERMEDLIHDLRAENERLREALLEISRDPRDDSVCGSDGWAYYSDVVAYAKDALK